MERNRREKGIVLAQRNWGDLHRLITLLSPQLGIIDVVAYGARKGKHAGGIEPFTCGTFFLYENRVKKSYSLSDVEVELSPSLMKEDLLRRYISSAIGEMTLLFHGGDYQAIYDLLIETLMLFEHDDVASQRLFIQYVIRLIEIMGILDDVTHCPVCNNPYSDDEVLSFNTSLNTPCCLKCSDITQEVNQLLLGSGMRRYIQFTRTLALSEAVQVEISQRATERLFRYMVGYVTTIIQRPLKSFSGGILELCI
ncbi:MAG: DNA repair protein RecO [Sphaerochaetaceae bacterium]|jgi:DNA repair protein RecO (recombination protein O)